MRKIIVSSVIIFLIGLNLNGQNLIGSNEKEIRKYMADNQKNMTFQNFTNNSTFKYLKYSDADETQTILFFLNEQLVCKTVRLVCDKSLKTQKIKDFNSLYKKAGDNQWTETKNGKSYLIEIKDEEWSFNITIKLIE
jgi:hypothetical protein